ncbi:unnamed protein product [Discosporangium mesarthrocarpum]
MGRWDGGLGRTGRASPLCLALGGKPKKKKMWQVLILLCFPVFSYAGVMATEAGMVDLKDIKPLLNRLRPSNRKIMNELPQMRRELQRDLRAFVRKVGPELGPIYTDPDLNWREYFKKQKGGAAEVEGIETMAENAAKVMEEAPQGLPGIRKKED